MTVPTNKAELLSAVNDAYRSLAQELASIPLGRTMDATLHGHNKGTQMSVHNLVAYLLGWGELVLKWHALRQANQSVDFPETGFKWNQLGLLAEKFYYDYACLPYPDLLARLDSNKATIAGLVEALSDADLYGAPWYGKWTLGRMIQFNTSSPYANARIRIRRWKRLQGLA